MTIAAGFAFKDGLLFCADTKITTDIKTNERKLFEQSYADGECFTVFAISADDFNLAKAAIRDCEEAVGKIHFADATIESIRNAIQSALVKFYKVHMFPRPDLKDSDFSLLVGIWLHNETRMYSSNQTVLNYVDKYECIGVGAYLAKYWIRKFIRANEPLTMEDAGLIASYAVKSTMDFDENCGGEEVDFLIMKNEGEIGEQVNFVIYPGNDFLDKTQAAMWTMVRDLTSVKPESIAVDTDVIVERFFEEVRKINRSYKWWLDLRSELRKSISPHDPAGEKNLK